MFYGVAHYKFNVKTLVQVWVSGTYPDYGFKVIKGTEGPGTYPYVCSSDHATADYRPKLTVDYTPSAIAPTSFGKVKALFK
ncbi:MAG TPA: DNRLRE domain-containing protein [bacterium]|nr:DNRLRE domain-containing protein [bacterium]